MTLISNMVPKILALLYGVVVLGVWAAKPSEPPRDLAERAAVFKKV